MQILLSFFILLTFLSCNKKERKPTHFRGVAMTIPYDVQISDKISPKQQELVEDVLSRLFFEIDESLNHWNLKSEVNNLHSSPTRVSHHLAKVLTDSKVVNILSKGRFDPSIYHVVKSWKESLDLCTVPDMTKQTRSFDMKSIKVNGNLLTYRNTTPKFDFDGISKGYTVDLIVQTLQEIGFENIFVNWGGEIKATGQFDKNRAWKVLVAHPSNVIETQEIFDLNGKAIATSGDFQQSWSVGDSIYTHIVNPETMQAKQVSNTSIASVTVLYDSCAIADALATTAMTFEDKNALYEWIAEIESKLIDVKFWVFCHEKQ